MLHTAAVVFCTAVYHCHRLTAGEEQQRYRAPLYIVAHGVLNPHTLAVPPPHGTGTRARTTCCTIHPHGTGLLHRKGLQGSGRVRIRGLHLRSALDMPSAAKRPHFTVSHLNRIQASSGGPAERDWCCLEASSGRTVQARPTHTT